MPTGEVASDEVAEACAAAFAAFSAAAAAAACARVIMICSPLTSSSSLPKEEGEEERVRMRRCLFGAVSKLSSIWRGGGGTKPPGEEEAELGALAGAERRRRFPREVEEARERVREVPLEDVPEGIETMEEGFCWIRERQY